MEGYARLLGAPVLAGLIAAGCATPSETMGPLADASLAATSGPGSAAAEAAGGGDDPAAADASLISAGDGGLGIPVDLRSRPSPRDFTPLSRLHDIHFDFDSATIRPDDLPVLDANAAWLRNHPGTRLLIEGHADERGTPEYNLALGDRRARASMHHLVSRGVAAARITVTSWGEERPLCGERHEGCWRLNRRAHFVVAAR